MKKNYKMLISYDGTRYFGWEHQPDKDTIQGKIETVLFRMCGEKEEIEVIGAGRTDAGVHAKGMAANAIMDTALSEIEIRDYMNRYLPDDIAVLSVEMVSDRFHARYNATGKTYQYTCFDGDVKSVFDRRYYTRLDSKVDVKSMQEAAAFLVGKHDYSSFAMNPGKKKSAIREIDSFTVERDGDYIYFTVHGNGFLRNMVRILVGNLLDVGTGRISPFDFHNIMEAKDRRVAGQTAPACGLCLLKVDYDNAPASGAKTEPDPSSPQEKITPINEIIKESKPS